MTDFDFNVVEAIQSTERYYREQIFSSGCSSMVSIYRITEHTKSVDSIKKQLQGSPYIQKGVRFSEQLVTTMLDTQLYVYEEKHFFLQGDLQGDISQFIESCDKVESFDEITGSMEETQIDWGALDDSLDTLVDKYSILSAIDLQAIVGQIKDLGEKIELDSSVGNYLQLFQQGQWSDKKEVNYTALLCMVTMGNHMGFKTNKLCDLIALGLLKDVGYTRLQNTSDNYEVLHPLVSHKIVNGANKIRGATVNTAHLSAEVVTAIALHHEFIDGSGVLSRMGHPLARKVLENKALPLIAQISGICDFYSSLLNEYDSACAYAVCLGFVSGHGNMVARYDQKVLDAFAEVFREKSYQNEYGTSRVSSQLLEAVFSFVKDQSIRSKAKSMVQSKSASTFDQITLGINLIRNLAVKDVKRLTTTDFSQVIKLPEEFSLQKA